MAAKSPVRNNVSPQFLSSIARRETSQILEEAFSELEKSGWKGRGKQQKTFSCGAYCVLSIWLSLSRNNSRQSHCASTIICHHFRHQPRILSLQLRAKRLVSTFDLFGLVPCTRTTTTLTRTKASCASPRHPPVSPHTHALPPYI